MVTLREILGKSYWEDGNWLKQPRIIPIRDVLRQRGSPSGSSTRRHTFSTSFFCVITQRVMVIPYRRFGTTYLPYLQGPRIPLFFGSWPSKMVPKDFPETSVRNYQYSLSNNTEERSSHLLRDGSPKSRRADFVIVLVWYLIKRNIKRWAGVVTALLITDVNWSDSISEL